MIQHVVRVEIRALRHSPPRGEFGEQQRKDADFFAQNKPPQGAVRRRKGIPLGRGEDFQQLCVNPFGGDIADILRITPRARQRIRGGRKSQLGGETAQAQQAQPVRSKDLPGGAAGLERFSFDRRPPAERIFPRTAREVVIDGVAGKIPAARILREIGRPLHRDGRVPAAGGIAFAPEGSKFKGRAASVRKQQRLRPRIFRLYGEPRGEDGRFHLIYGKVPREIGIRAFRKP